MGLGRQPLPQQQPQTNRIKSGRCCRQGETSCQKLGKITNDPWVLQAITGYRIEFDEQPVQHHIPNEIPFNQEQWAIVDNEVKELLRIGAIVPSESEPDEFISTIFIVPKPNGKFRPVINLRYLK